MTPLKHLFKSVITSFIRLFSKTRLGFFIYNEILQSSLGQTVDVEHKGNILTFHTPNPLSVWRADTFSTKEPETLDWIEGMNPQSVFWDIGANVGLYSCYAAKSRDCNVVAIEPSVFNIEWLARNIHINNLERNISIVPIALSNHNKMSMFNLTSTNWGGALSTFGEDFGWDGKKIEKTFQYKTLGMKMDCLATMLKLEQPDYIKMDVDGLEHMILSGGPNIIKKSKQLLIEINDNFLQQKNQAASILSGLGFKLALKTHSELIAKSTSGFDQSFNQIWIRSNCDK